MRDPVENDLARGRLSLIYCIRLRFPIQEDAQFRNVGYPAAVGFPI
jgi:hypothetical protein